MMPLYESVKDYNCHEEQKKHITKSQTHCNSCGAPINPYLYKCEYCGTYYTNNSYANYLKGKYLEASIKNETAILSSHKKLKNIICGETI